jgi:hypothetical protein
VNFKVLYIGRGNVIYTCFVAAFVRSVEFRVELGVNELIEMIDIG